MNDSGVLILAPGGGVPAFTPAVLFTQAQPVSLASFIVVATAWLYLYGSYAWNARAHRANRPAGSERHAPSGMGVEGLSGRQVEYGR